MGNNGPRPHSCRVCRQRQIRHPGEGESIRPPCSRPVTQGGAQGRLCPRKHRSAFRALGPLAVQEGIVRGLRRHDRIDIPRSTSAPTVVVRFPPPAQRSAPGVSAGEVSEPERGITAKEIAASGRHPGDCSAVRSRAPSRSFKTGRTRLCRMNPRGGPAHFPRDGMSGHSVDRRVPDAAAGLAINRMFPSGGEGVGAFPAVCSKRIAVVIAKEDCRSSTDDWSGRARPRSDRNQRFGSLRVAASGAQNGVAGALEHGPFQELSRDSSRIVIHDSGCEFVLIRRATDP